MDRHLRCHAFEFRQGCGLVAGDVRLVDDDHRLRTAVADQRQIANRSIQVEIAVERGDDQHRIDIGRDQLGPAFTRSLANECTAAWQNRFYDCRPVAITRPQRNKITNSRQIRAQRSSVAHTAGNFCCDLAGFRCDLEMRTMFANNPPRHQALLGILGKLRLADFGPTERIKRHASWPPGSCSQLSCFAPA